MLTLPQLYLFSAASLAILIMPGPAVFYGTLQSIQYGRTAGIAAVLGLEFATLFHVMAAALGIPALAASTELFILLKGCGTGYLIYLGVCKLAPLPKMQQRVAQPKGLPQIFWQGFLVELCNPKTMLFFFAFLPQFVTPTRGGIALQVAALGFVFIGLAIVVDLLYAMTAGSVGLVLKDRQSLSRKLRYIEGSVYFSFGLTLAFSQI